MCWRRPRMSDRATLYRVPRQDSIWAQNELSFEVGTVLRGGRGKRMLVDHERSRMQCGVGLKRSAGTFLPLFVFNLEEGCSKQAIRRQSRSNDADRPSLASPQSCCLLRFRSLAPGSQAFPSQWQDALGRRDNKGCGHSSSV